MSDKVAEPIVALLCVQSSSTGVAESTCGDVRVVVHVFSVACSMIAAKLSPGFIEE